MVLFANRVPVDSTIPNRFYFFLLDLQICLFIPIYIWYLRKNIKSKQTNKKLKFKDSIFSTMKLLFLRLCWAKCFLKFKWFQLEAKFFLDLNLPFVGKRWPNALSLSLGFFNNLFPFFDCISSSVDFCF